MKKLLTLFTFTFLLFNSYSQSVGIGTTTPNVSAQLDISSTSKGLLIPRMTSMQRNAIAAPIKSLLVFDTDINSFVFYDGTSWKQLITGTGESPWVKSSDAIYTGSNLNVGIGTAIPTAKLHVIGNIKNTGRVDADGVIEGGGISSTGTLYINGTSLLQGAVTGNATGLFYGTITSNAGVTINNAAAILSLKASGDDKGFVQLSGDDLRLGTYSTNTLGKFIVRTGGTNNLTVTSDGNTGIGMEDPVAKLQVNSGGSNTTLRLQADGAPLLQFYSGTTSIGSIQGTGTNLRIIAPGNRVDINSVLYADAGSNRVGIGTSAPEEKLQVAGNIKVTGEVYRPATGDYNMLPVCYGRVSSAGNLSGGTPNITNIFFQPQTYGGYYQIACDAVTTSSVVLVTVAGSSGAAVIPVVQTSTGYIQIKFFSDFLEYNFSDNDVIGAQVTIHFVVYNP